MKRILLVLAVSLFAACGGEDPAGPIQTYDVAGVITRLPAGPGTELMIRHDEIPNFVNVAGEEVGMGAMVMGFPVAESVDLTSFAEGDSVSFTFVVRWGQPKPLQLTRMEKR